LFNFTFLNNEFCFNFWNELKGSKQHRKVWQQTERSF
jgi:hypothetical protein